MSKDIEIKKATITGTMLGYEDHGLLSSMVYLKYGAGAQGFGGYSLGDDVGGINFAGAYIGRLLKTVGVEKWEDLRGKNVRVKASHDKVHAIGHILEDRWFSPAELAKECKAAG